MGLQAAPEMVQMHGGPSRDAAAQDDGLADRRAAARRARQEACRRGPHESVSRGFQLHAAGRSEDRERLRLARRAGVHHRRAVSRFGNRRPTGRRAGPRDRPRDRAARQQADGAESVVPRPRGGRRRRGRRRQQRPHGPGRRPDGANEIRPRRRTASPTSGACGSRRWPATIRGR